MRNASYGEQFVRFGMLLFIHGMATSMWLVPLSNVLDAYHQHPIKAYAFAATAVAAFFSPLLFGTIADRHVGLLTVLRWASLGAAVTTFIAVWAIDHQWPSWIVLVCIQLLALFSTPTWGLGNAAVLAALRDAKKEFGPIRAMGTVGWMAGCWTVSALAADASTAAGWAAIVAWLALAAFTFSLPHVYPQRSAARLSLRERFGLDALALLKIPQHRVVFLTGALVSIPLAAFYPFTPPHLKALGFQHTSAWMSLGQVSEVVAMFSLSFLLIRFRLKWIFALGLCFAFMRYFLCAQDQPWWLLAGISLHGFAFTLVFITGPIYLDGQVDPAWRARAQSLMTLMNSGVGNLLGYLTCGWWFQACERGGTVRWPLFWTVLAGAVAMVLAYFLAAFPKSIVDSNPRR